MNVALFVLLLLPAFAGPPMAPGGRPSAGGAPPSIGARFSVPSGDTLVNLEQGDLLVLENFIGFVSVETWERPVLRLSSGAEGSVLFRLRRSGNRLSLEVRDEKGRRRPEDLRIMAPPWMDLELQGRELEARVEGMAGSVAVRTLEGDLTLVDLGGEVDAYSMEGRIEASGLTGSAHLQSGDEDLKVRDSSGPLDLETLDGDILLERVESRRASARTTDGDIEFSGTIPQGGEVELRSHGGDLRVRLAPPRNLDVAVLAYRGEFESEFPVRAKGFRSGEPMEFTLGSGGARLVLEAFDGDIELLGTNGGHPPPSR